MTRAEWQTITDERRAAAQVLLASGYWASAYYLVGDAVAAGLKSCILTLLSGKPELIFRDRRFSERCWTHKIEELVTLADLESVRDADTASNPLLGVYWGLVKKWTENSRYEMKSQAEAEDLDRAITDPVNGVMQWIKARW